MRVSIFCTAFVWIIFHSRNKRARCDKKMYIGLHVKYRYSCPSLMKLEFSKHIFKKILKIKFHDNPFSGSWVVQCGQTDGRTGRHDEADSRFFLRNFANTLNKNEWTEFMCCSFIDTNLIHNFYINYIKLSSSTCFERQPLIFRRSMILIVHVCSLWYSH